MATITDQEIQISIAQDCGWKKGREIADGEWVWKNPDGQSRGQIAIPDFVNDLNAINDAVNALSPAQRLLWLNELNIISNRDDPKNTEWFATRCATSSARQRAEAFLRATGHWKSHDEREYSPAS